MSRNCHSPRLFITALCLFSVGIAPPSIASTLDSTGFYSLDIGKGSQLYERREPNAREIIVDHSFALPNYRAVIRIRRRKRADSFSPGRLIERMVKRRIASVSGETSMRFFGRGVSGRKIATRGQMMVLVETTVNGYRVSFRCAAAAADWQTVEPLCAKLLASLVYHPKRKTADRLPASPRLIVTPRPRLHYIWWGFRYHPNHYTAVQLHNVSDRPILFKKGMVQQLDRIRNPVALRSFGPRIMRKSGWIYGFDGLAVSDVSSGKVPAGGGVIFLLQSPMSGTVDRRVDHIQLQLNIDDSNGNPMSYSRKLKPRRPRKARFGFPLSGTHRVARGPQMHFDKVPRYVVLRADGSLVGPAPRSWRFRANDASIVALADGKVVGRWFGLESGIIIKHGTRTVVYRGLYADRVIVKVGSIVKAGDLLGRTAKLNGFIDLRCYAGSNMLAESAALTFKRLQVRRGSRFRPIVWSPRKGDLVRRGKTRRRHRKKSRKKPK